MAATKEKSKVKLVPLRGFALLSREKSHKNGTSGAIFLPDSAKDKPTRGKIVSVGTDSFWKMAAVLTLQVKVGDLVLFTSYAGENIEVDGEEYLLMNESEVLAVIG